MNKTSGLIVVLMCALVGCNESPVETQLPTGMNLGWKSLPHRIAATELTAHIDQENPTVVAQNNGGDFGAVDTATASYQTIAIAHPGLVVEEVSTYFVIDPATDPLAQDAYLQTETIVLPESLSSSPNVAFLYGAFASIPIFTSRLPASKPTRACPTTRLLATPPAASEWVHRIP